MTRNERFALRERAAVLALIQEFLIPAIPISQRRRLLTKIEARKIAAAGAEYEAFDKVCDMLRSGRDPFDTRSENVTGGR